MSIGASSLLASPISRIGSKYNMLSWLLPQIPHKEQSVYIEPFLGSGVVVLNREPSQLEILNDIDGSLIRFMHVLQDEILCKKLKARLAYTLYSKQEYILANELLKKDVFSNEIDFAWSYFVAVRQSFCKKIGASWGRCVTLDTNRKWSKVFDWFSGIAIDRFVDRIRYAQIENDTFQNIIQRYDSENAIFYCDPPYLPETRNGAIYEKELSYQDHIILLTLLLRCKGAVCLSGYPSKLYSEMLNDWKFTQKETFCHLGRNSPTGIKNEKRTECLWRNKKAMEYFSQDCFF